MNLFDSPKYQVRFISEFKFLDAASGFLKGGDQLGDFAVAGSYPDDFWGVATCDAMAVEMDVLGDDDEAVALGVGDNFLVGPLAESQRGNRRALGKIRGQDFHEARGEVLVEK
jgi:hypothetical protein